MNVDRTIDYLQFSTPSLATPIEGYPEVSKSYMGFYQRMRTYPCGLTVHTGNPNSAKELVVMTGKTCAKYQDTIKQFMSDEVSQGAKFSRVDFCVTVDKIDLLYKFKDIIASGKFTSRRFKDCKNLSLIPAGQKVETQYVGDLEDRSKKGIFRAYDKGAQLGIDIELSRFELETRQTVANNNALRWIDGTNMGSIIRSSIDLPQCKWWQEIMGDKVELKQMRDIETYDMSEIDRRWKWLIEKVAPSLGKSIAYDDMNERGNKYLFWQEMEKAYNMQIAIMKDEDNKK